MPQPTRHALPSRRWLLPAVLLLALVAAAIVVPRLRHGPPPTRNIFAATTQSLAPVADATVAADSPTRNFGASTALRSDGSPVVRSYLRFSLAGVPSVEGATLRVEAETSAGAGFQVQSTAGGWSELAVTYETAPAPGRVLGTSGPLTAGGWASIDLTTAAVAATGHSLNLVIASTSTTAIRYGSREAGVAAPSLVVELGAGPPPSSTTPPPTTLPAAGTTGAPVLVAVGDVACDPTSQAFQGGLGTAGNCHQKALADLALQLKPAAVAILGDSQYEDGALAKFQASYDPSWGRLKAVTHPALGNHEYLTAGAAGYFAYFGAAAGPAGKGYYSYNVGGWHLIALNSNCSQVGGCNAGSPQEQWLKADLAAHPTACALAYWHHPRFSSGDHGSFAAVDPLWRDLYNGGVDIVLNGHDHDYERFAPQDPNGVADPAHGIREWVVGTGGKNHYGFTVPQGIANSETRDASTYGFLKLVLRAGGYDWQFVPDPGGTFSDSGSGSCH